MAAHKAGAIISGNRIHEEAKGEKGVTQERHIGQKFAGLPRRARNGTWNRIAETVRDEEPRPRGTLTGYAIASKLSDLARCRVTFLLTVYTKSSVQKCVIWACAHGIAP